MAERQSAPAGTPEGRIGPGTKRGIRDVFTPDAAGDERLDGLIEQLRQLEWPPTHRAEAQQ